MFAKSKEPKMVQLNGQTGAVETEVKGKERILSIPDTEEVVRLAKQPVSEASDLELGTFFLQVVERQNNRAEEYTNS